MLDFISFQLLPPSQHLFRMVSFDFIALCSIDAQVNVVSIHFNLGSAVATVSKAQLDEIVSAVQERVQNRGTVYTCTVLNGRRRKCFRARVFALGEHHLAHIRANAIDGIVQDDTNLLNLKISLVFESKSDALRFQSALSNYVTSVLCKRDRDELNPATDIRVDQELISSTDLTGALLSRVMQKQYAHDFDTSLTVNSPDCDSLNDSTSIYAGSVLDVDISPEVVLQMLENPKHDHFVGKPAEVAHLKSQTKYPKSASNINNQLYLSR